MARRGSGRVRHVALTGPSHSSEEGKSGMRAEDAWDGVGREDVEGVRGGAVNSGASSGAREGILYHSTHNSSDERGSVEL